MRFLGLIAGLLIGAALDDFEGALWGAALGLLIGHVLRMRQGKGVEGRLQQLEAEVRTLRAAVDAMRPPPASATAPTAVPSAQVPVELASQTGLERTPELATPLPEPVARPAEGASPRPQPTLARHAERQQRPAWLAWLLGGNTVVRVGVVILFFGVAFLLKYAYDHTNLPIEARLTGVALGAIGMLVVGWRLRLRMPGYALAVQGGAVGVLYLTVFASFRLFGLLPPGAALTLLFLIGALSAALAVLQNAQSLAILGAGGGFLAPILASTGSGSHVMLFGYYAMLNSGILAIAWFRAWRPLNLVGFAFTFGIGALWGADHYRPDLFASTEPFLLLFFLMYLAIPVLFAGREATRNGRYLDTTLVFGVPIIAFGMQLRLVRGIEYGAAWSALALGLAYLVLARVLFRRSTPQLRMLIESFLALGVVFATLAIPLAFDGRWTSAAWALEGAAVIWIGVRQQRALARAFGMLLQFLAGAAFFSAGGAHGEMPVLNSFYLGCVLMALAGLFANWWLERNRAALRPWEPALAVVLFAWGTLWWLVAGLTEIDRHVTGPAASDAALLFLAGTALAYGFLHARVAWRLARYPALALLPAAALVAVLVAGAALKAHPLAELGWLAWPAVFAAHLWVIRRFEGIEAPAIEVLHAAGLWLLAAVGAWELAWWIDHAVQGQGAWPLIAWAIVPGALLMLLALHAERLSWPVRQHLPTYLLTSAAPLAGFLWLWVLYANVGNDGDPAPLPYVPVLNPLDLAQIGALLVIAWWMRTVRRLALVEVNQEGVGIAAGIVGAGAFVAANGALLRALHHYADIPYQLVPLWHSMLVQAALAIFWSLLALATMVIATRLRMRPLWITGAALMGVVVAKLFLVDLSNVSGVERIVSFIGVGLLMLVIGYLSPVPPRNAEAAR